VYKLKPLAFQKYVTGLIKHSYVLSQIGNADQTLLYFEVLSAVDILSTRKVKKQ
jgi:hypothetical protein